MGISVCLLTAILPAGVLFGQIEATWALAETDCQFSGRDWTIGEAVDEYHTGPDCQRVHFRASWGTRVLVAADVPPAWVIEELQPSLWVKGTRPDIQMYARVVLPRTRDPVENGPMTVLLPGPVYRTTGRWQKLDFADIRKSLPELLEEAVWKLRARFDQPVDAGEAWLDKLVLNVYTGTGVSTVWIDDVEIAGAVAADPSRFSAKRSGRNYDAGLRPVSFEQDFAGQAGQRPALSRTDGTILEVRSQPFFMRSIQHNGEPFEVLRELGFNTVELDQTATLQQLAQAERLDMWIVCPPPESAGADVISAEFDRVLAWSLGQNLDYSDLQRIEVRAREISESDFREGRPLVAFTGSAVAELARTADILGVGFEALGGSFILSQYSDWISQRAELARKNLPLWASLQTEVCETVRSQTAALGVRVPPMPLEASQIKFMAYEAIAGGARGLRFLSRSRLDAQNPVSNLRSLSLRWLNAHLQQLEPWISAGAVVSRTTAGGRDQQLTTLATPNAKLILVQRTSRQEQLVAGGTPVSDFRFSDPSLSASESAFHLAESGMIPLDQGRSLAGNEITIENCGTLEAVLITRDPVVINRLAESYLLDGQETLARLHLGIARQWMTIVGLINEQLTRIGRNSPTASGSINEANNALQQAQALVSSGSAMTANRLLCLADQKLAAARMDILSGARGPFASQTSSPLLTHISLVPLHFELISRIDPQAWQPNGLAGGDFENLDHMTRNQWENHRCNDKQLRTHVELSTEVAVRGERSLLMRVSDAEGGAGDTLVDRTPLWIRSSPVPVQGGQLVRIHGWVRIDQALRGSLDGLMIIDSVGGPQLAERILLTQGWQEFTMYRCPPEDSDLRITFALTGYGTVWLDEVDVRVVQPGTGVRQARQQ
jgi:hypothetical protein